MSVLQHEQNENESAKSAPREAVPGAALPAPFAVPLTNRAYVTWRLQHGSMCYVCPLRGQRMVGLDGPIDASIIGLAEAPGEDEEGWGRARGEPYGTPLVGKSGYRMRIENLLPAGLVSARYVEGKPWPILHSLQVLLVNVILCRPPKNDIDTPVGRAAVRCCSNSARAFLRTLLSQNPNRTIVAVGGTALSVLRRRATKVDPHRGRVTHHSDVASFLAQQLAPEPEEAILRAVLKGKKPRETWWPRMHKTLKAILALQRRGLRSAAKRAMNPSTSATTKKSRKPRSSSGSSTTGGGRAGKRPRPASSAPSA